MKYTTRIILTMALFFSILFSGCNYEEPVSELKSISFENNPASFRSSINYTPNQYGFFHNEGLRIFMTNRPDYKYTTFSKLVSDISVEFHKEYADVHFENADYDRVNLIFDFQNSSFEEVMKNTYEGQVTPKINGLLDYILLHKLSYDDATAKISDYISKTELSEEELYAIKLFSTVAKHSNSFWSSKHKQKMLDCNPKHQVYFADAVGLLIFGPFGGIGYSWGVDAAQDEFYEGGCID